MKKNFTKKLMAAAILLVTAVSPSWADYTISKSNGDPAVEGTDYFFEDATTLVIQSSGLTLSGTLVSSDDKNNCHIVVAVDDCTLTLKDATISSNYVNGALCLVNQNPTLVLEGTNSIINTGTDGSAVHMYNGRRDLTITGEGELYLSSQSCRYGVYAPCLYGSYEIGNTNYLCTITAEGFIAKGSTKYNASISELTDAVVGTYDYEEEMIGRKMQYATFLVGEDFCNTVWIKAVPAFDPDTEYVVVTYKEGSDTKKAYYKATDVEKIEWLKGEDITE